MKRLIVLILLMTVLVACGSTKDADEANVEKEEDKPKNDKQETDKKTEQESEKNQKKNPIKHL